MGVNTLTTSRQQSTRPCNRQFTGFMSILTRIIPSKAEVRPKKHKLKILTTRLAKAKLKEENKIQTGTTEMTALRIQKNITKSIHQRRESRIQSGTAEIIKIKKKRRMTKKIKANTK